MMLFSYTNVYDITSEDLPFYSLLQRLGYDWLTVVYIIIVFIAVLSTVVGFAFAGVARFSKYYQPKEGKKSSLRDAIFVGVSSSPAPWSPSSASWSSSPRATRSSDT